MPIRLSSFGQTCHDKALRGLLAYRASPCAAPSRNGFRRARTELGCGRVQLIDVQIGYTRFGCRRASGMAVMGSGKAEATRTVGPRNSCLTSRDGWHFSSPASYSSDCGRRRRKQAGRNEPNASCAGVGQVMPMLTADYLPIKSRVIRPCYGGRLLSARLTRWRRKKGLTHRGPLQKRSVGRSIVFQAERILLKM